MMSENSTKLTIVTVVKNAAAALEETLLSVQQNAPWPFDYIVVDGASEDGTREVIRKHEGMLKFWLSEPDQGVYDAMNKGWSHADPSSLVLFLGAGDRLLSLPEGVLPGGEAREILYGNVCLENDLVFHARADARLKLYNSLHHQALLVPKRLHPAPPFDLDYKLYADFDFNQRLYKEGVTFRFVPDFRSFAASGGLTQETNPDELRKIVLKNYGPVWAGTTALCFSLARLFPFIKKLRPIH